MHGFVFTVVQTVDRSDPLDQRESHWYRTFVGILRLLRPSKGNDAVFRAPQLPKNPLETRMIPAFPSILLVGCASNQSSPTCYHQFPLQLASLCDSQCQSSWSSCLLVLLDHHTLHYRQTT